MTQTTRQTHLEFYREHQIIPVSYDLTDMDAHLQRRFALYAQLGLPPLAFHNADILEVAAGTGHNSLYIAQSMPSSLVLLEPNAVAVEHIQNTYQAFDRPHVKPLIISQMLEDYLPNTSFDMVLCENWLGNSEHELALLRKLSSFVTPQGQIVLTTVSPIGFVPNLLRRYLSTYLAPLDAPFHVRTEQLVDAFHNHLHTLTAMTRSATDWVQDNMQNPAYFNLCLSIPTLLMTIGHQFDVLGSSPCFKEDWRWFKGVYGQNSQWNEHFLSEYWHNAHNFLDHRALPLPSNHDQNVELELNALKLLSAIHQHEDAAIQQSTHLKRFATDVATALDDFITSVPQHLTTALSGLNEVRTIIDDVDSIQTESVARMTNFSALFGRETVYVSMIRRNL